MMLCALMFLSALTVGPTSVDSSLARAERLFLNHHLHRGWFDSASVLLAEVRRVEPGNQSGLALRVRFTIRRGDCAGDPAVKQRFYRSAAAAADTLRKLNDANPEGHFWWATARGRIAEHAGIMKSLSMVGPLKREFVRALVLDSRFVPAYYALGRMYYELPGIVGGSLDRAAGYYEQGLAIDPDYSILRLGLARVYLRQKRRAEARKELNRLLATVMPTVPYEFELEDKPAAQRMLIQLDGR